LQRTDQSNPGDVAGQRESEIVDRMTVWNRAADGIAKLPDFGTAATVSCFALSAFGLGIKGKLKRSDERVADSISASHIA